MMSLRDMLLLATIATYFSKLVAAMDMPMAMGPSAMPMAPSPAFTEPCLLDPKTASCANFELAGDLIEANIVKLCTAMPYMIGCTLNDQCQDGTATGAYCEPFSLLANICVDMPRMKGCEEYNAMCVAGTSVAACSAPGPAPALLMTVPTGEDILSMCEMHDMDGCEECTATFSACPDPMATISKLCPDMPSMSQCTDYLAFCSSDAAESFPALCDASAPENNNNITSGAVNMATSMWKRGAVAVSVALVAAYMM